MAPSLGATNKQLRSSKYVTLQLLWEEYSAAGSFRRLPLADLCRQSVYSRMAGYEDVNDVERLSQDPTSRLIASERIWDREAALTSRLQTFKTEMLAEEENLRTSAAWPASTAN
jgi:hypothetical protein